MSSTKNLLKGDRLFQVLSDQVYNYEQYNVELFDLLVSFIDQYIGYHKLSPKAVAKSYKSFIRSYNKDARLFSETGKYPLELDANRAEPLRTDYSIILLLSTLLTAHRFRIMQLVRDTAIKDAKGLFVGCGPGLEIELLHKQIGKIVAYDLVLDDFLDVHFKDKVTFKADYFDGSGDEKYDCIYLIEILEHLIDPYELLEKCKRVLSAKGKIYLTTATNIPQFDHLYKFPKAHVDFDNRIKDMGLRIEMSEEIVHNYITKSIGSMNKFYILTQ